MSFKTDLHVHSWHSDGVLSPVELVEKYVEEKYDLISITDHEVIKGIKEAEEAGKDKNLRVIPGIEIPVTEGEFELHILGYYFDLENPQLCEKLQWMAETRRQRNEKMLTVLQDMGYDITAKDLLQREGQTYIGKPNFARALVSKGYIKNTAQAFEPGKLLESPEIKQIKRAKLSAEEAIELIKQAGGMAVLAHPYKIKKLGERGSEEFKHSFDELLRGLKKKGLKGLECIYPKHTDEERLFFIDTAGKYHLHITEGSDFHGDK